MQTIMEMVGHTRLDCVIGAPPRNPPGAWRGRSHHAAHRAAFGRSLDGSSADAERARRSRDRIRGRDGAGAAPGAGLRSSAIGRARAALRAARHGRRQVLDLQAHAAARGRGPRMPGWQRLRRGVRASPALSRGAGELDLGGLRQRDVSRRPARAHTRARERGRVLRRASAWPPESTGGSTHSWRRSATSWRSGRRWRPERAASSSTWPSRSRHRCWCVRASRRWPTRSSRRESRAAAGSRSARFPRGRFQGDRGAPRPAL